MEINFQFHFEGINNTKEKKLIFSYRNNSSKYIKLELDLNLDLEGKIFQEFWNYFSQIASDDGRNYSHLLKCLEKCLVKMTEGTWNPSSGLSLFIEEKEKYLIGMMKEESVVILEEYQK